MFTLFFTVAADNKIMSNKLFQFGFSCDKKDDSGSYNKRKRKEESKKLYEQTKWKEVFCRK